MSEAVRERLSALVDGELDEVDTAQVVDRVVRDRELARVWGAYTLIGDVLRRDTLGGGEARGVYQRVHDRIRDEATLYSLRTFRSSVVRPLAGLAVAASVAVVAVLGVRSLEPVADAVQVAATVPPPPTPSGREEGRALPDAGLGLEAYLVNHSQRAVPSVHGVLPYARIVAHDAAR
jgi:sigma-E factor negative regulatory protein RseA